MSAKLALSSRTRNLVRVIVGTVLFFGLLVTDHFVGADVERQWRLLVYLVPYLVLGVPVLLGALSNIKSGHIFDENFLMSVATIGALALGEYPEAVAVMCFFQIGELFEDYAVDKSRKSISEMMDICPETANIERDGALVEVDPYEVSLGSVIVVKPGERIPIDGVVVEGLSELDTSALTGESYPREIKVGDEVASGSINLSKNLRIRTTREFEDSTVSKILELVENAAEEKSQTENFITRFARYYTPVVCGLALLLALVPPFFTGFDWGTWIQRALIFLVVSCPCALVISVPLSFFGGIGGASRKGIMVKGSCYLETLSKVDTMLFDKTGTLTKGEFAVSKLRPNGVSADELLSVAAHAEAYSNHPIAVSVRGAFAGAKESDVEGHRAPSAGALDLSRVSDIEEIAGRGISCKLDGRRVLAGNKRLMDSHGIPCDDDGVRGTVLHVARDGEYLGRIEVEDVIKEDTPRALEELRSLGVDRRVMLTGDREEVAKNVSSQVAISEYHAGLLPEDKITHLKDYLSGSKRRDGKHKVAFVGDGINDAPALMMADVGIAMGAMGSDAAIEAADVVLMDDKPGRLATAIRIARKTMGIVWANIIFALAVKVVIMVLAVSGIANMWIAIFGDVGVTIIAILNAMRALRVKD